MNVDIRGTRILITGSSKGIGKGLATGLAREGASLFLSARDEETLGKTVMELRRFNPCIWEYPSDLTSDRSLEELVGRAVDTMEGVDVLIINSGNPPGEPSLFDETTMEQWDYSIKLFLRGPIKLVRLTSEYMKRERFGRIIFLSSFTVKEPHDPFTLADVSRSPIIQLTRLLARQYGKYGITTNALLMGSFPTEGAERSLREIAKREGRTYEEVWNELVVKPIPVGFIGNPEVDLKGVVTLIISKYGRYINGSFFTIDGGVSRWA